MAIPRGYQKVLPTAPFSALSQQPFPQLLQRYAFRTASLQASHRLNSLEKQDDKIQKTKHKLQKRDIDAYELSYAQLGHKNGTLLDP